MEAGTQERQSQMELTFGQVWAMFQAMSQEADKRQQETDRHLKESREAWDRGMKESRETWDRGMRESRAEHDRIIKETAARQEKTEAELEKTNQIVKELSKNIGGVNKSFGRLMEEMYSARLWDKFSVFGYDFTCGCRRKKFRENERTIAEADIFLENGLYAMVVEVKTDLTTEDVDDHLERIATIRKYMDSHGDKRFLVGAVAGGIEPENVVRYAQKKGLYVVAWSGEAATVAEAPPSFEAREWRAV